MRVLGRAKPESFKRKHSLSSGSINAWLAEAESAEWRKWADIKAKFPKADWLGNNRVVFDIKSNDFRLVVLVYFQMGQVIVERIGTHAEYDRWRLKEGRK